MSALVVTSGQGKGHTYQISPDRDNVVGRVAGCDVCIVDTRISRKHCAISAGQTGYTIRDLGSANGVWLNGKRVKEAGFQDGDKLRLGLTELEFHQTERFEDAETKRLAAGEGEPPHLDLPPKKKSERAKPPALEFCGRCSGSIPPADIEAGRAREIKGKLLCVECLAGEQASADAAAVLPEAGERARSGRGKADAEEVSRLAEEVAAEADDEAGGKLSGGRRSEEVARTVTDMPKGGEGEAILKLEEPADPQTGELVFLDEEGNPREKKQAPKKAEEKPAAGKEEEPAAEPPVPKSSAKTVRQPAAKAPAKSERKLSPEFKEKLLGGDGPPGLEPVGDEELIEAVDELVEVDEEGLPDLPAENSPKTFDEDAATPRPGADDLWVP